MDNVNIGRTRDWRRSQRERIKSRARDIFRNWYTPGFDGDREEYVRDKSRFADTIQRCSCISCGNQRQYEGPPISELRRISSTRSSNG